MVLQVSAAPQTPSALLSAASSSPMGRSPPPGSSDGVGSPAQAARVDRRRGKASERVIVVTLARSAALAPSRLVATHPALRAGAQALGSRVAFRHVRAGTGRLRSLAS